MGLLGVRQRVAGMRPLHRGHAERGRVLSQSLRGSERGSPAESGKPSEAERRACDGPLPRAGVVILDRSRGAPVAWPRTASLAPVNAALTRSADRVYSYFSQTTRTGRRVRWRGGNRAG